MWVKERDFQNLHVYCHKNRQDPCRCGGERKLQSQKRHLSNTIFSSDKNVPFFSACSGFPLNLILSEVSFVSFILVLFSFCLYFRWFPPVLLSICVLFSFTCLTDLMSATCASLTPPTLISAFLSFSVWITHEALAEDPYTDLDLDYHPALPVKLALTSSSFLP